MRKIDDGDGIREYNTRDLIELFRDEVLEIHKSDVDDWEADLMISQYSYVKFGLLLEQVRNGSWWNRCIEKFADFRQFCQQKVNLNIWQVANAIKSAQVAVKLSYLGFTEFPRNASQALKLDGLSIERLGEVWGNILTKCAGHKITADAIAKEINPDVQPMKSSVLLPVGLADKLSREALMRGISVAEYIQELMDLEQAVDSEVEPVAESSHVTVIDYGDIIEPVKVSIEPVKVSIEPKQIIKSVGSSIDRMRAEMFDRYFPKWKTAVCHE